MKKSLCIVVALMLTLIACSTMGLDREAAAGLCRQANDHCIQVTVYKDASGASKIEVDNHELHVRGRQHVIFWRLVNAGTQAYKFPDDGIAFKTDPGKKELTCRKMDDVVFWCSNPNNTQGKFEYGITVTGSPVVPPLDPWVVND